MLKKKMINTLLYVVTLQKLVVVLALVPDQALIAMTNVLDYQILLEVKILVVIVKNKLVLNVLNPLVMQK